MIPFKDHLKVEQITLQKHDFPKKEKGGARSRREPPQQDLEEGVNAEIIHYKQA
tara:strand:- start:2497 stop:2658 length:162 start_codon:yes stop_codon:yes gene_type:complete